MSQFNCIECGTVYTENNIPEDYVCKGNDCPGNGLTGLIIPIEEEAQSTNGTSSSDTRRPIVATRECGLCVLLMDASGSMFYDPAFKGMHLPSQYGDEFCTKAEIVSKAAAQAIFQLQSMVNNINAYICAIRFDHSQALMFNDTIHNIINKHQSADKLARYFYDELSKMKGGTDINAALKMAHAYVGKFTNSKIPGMGDFVPLYHKQYLPNLQQSEDIPNIRTLIYTDGEQLEQYGALATPFAGGNIDLLMGAFIGDQKDLGCADLQNIISNCPIHGEKQFFVLDAPQKLATLRGLFRMASGTSGFCPKCIPNQPTVLR